METIAVERTTWRGLPAWRLSATTLELVVSEVGAHIASITRRGETLNPLWVPPWPAADPATAGPGQAWGDGPEATLLAGICGHNLCIDRFGGPWPGEDRPVHGEAGVRRWSLAPPARAAVELRVELPQARLAVSRRFRFDGDTAHVDTGVTHRGDGARDIEWAEHPTIGDPFLDGAVVTAGVDRAWNWPLAADPATRFRGAAAGAPLPIAAALSVPARGDAPCGDVLTSRVTDGWWAAENRALGRRLTYRWDARRFPWLAIWTEHRGRTGAPWNGRTRTRGMEFSTKPFPEGKPAAERASAWQGRPTTCTVPAGRRLKTTWSMRWERL
ncbi:MAG TPA: hypothetical protein VEL07_00335 [Planctomycetota bacterium]|nr:hypothetical protein [Planctomycetota bacterium]